MGRAKDLSAPRYCTGWRFPAINSMYQSPSWEAGSRTVGQEILHLLWNLKVLYRVDNSRTFPEAAEYIPHGILSFIVRSSYSSLAIFGLKFSRYFVCSSCVVYFMFCPARPCRFDRPNDVWWGIQYSLPQGMGKKKIKFLFVPQVWINLICSEIIVGYGKNAYVQVEVTYIMKNKSYIVQWYLG